MKEPSALERSFMTRWRQLAPRYPEPTPEYRFWLGRKWRFDYSWPADMIAVELEGIGSAKSRHTSYMGYTQDCMKYNAAVTAGWHILRFTSMMLDNDPDACIEQIKILLDRANR